MPSQRSILVSSLRPPMGLQWPSTALDAGPLRFGQHAGPSRGGPGKSARARAWGLGVGEDCPAGSPGARRAWSRGSRSADAAVARGGSPPLDARGAEVEPPPPRALFEAERPGKEGVPVCWPAWGGVGATAFAVSGGRPAGPPKGGNRHAGLLLRGGAEPEVRNQSLTNKALFLRSDQLKSDSCSGGKPEGLGLAGGVTMALSKMIPEQGRGGKTRNNLKGPAGRGSDCGKTRWNQHMAGKRLEQPLMGWAHWEDAVATPTLGSAQVW